MYYEYDHKSSGIGVQLRVFADSKRNALYKIRNEIKNEFETIENNHIVNTFIYPDEISLNDIKEC